MDTALADSVASGGYEGQSLSENPSDQGGQAVQGKPEGQPDNGAQEPTKDNAPNWERDYKELQGKFTKDSQRWADIGKKADQYGGLDTLIQTAEYLTGNPEFAKWVESQKGKNSFKDLGIDEGDIDDDTRRALELVEKVAGKKASEIISQIVKQKIDPIENTYKEQMIEGHFKTMDSKYGAEWRDLQSVMADLAESLPAEIQENPSVKDLEALYFRALAESGKFDDFAASKYQKKLEAVKKNSSDKPSGGNVTSPKQANSIYEAYQLAKQAQK